MESTCVISVGLNLFLFFSGMDACLSVIMNKCDRGEACIPVCPSVKMVEFAPRLESTFLVRQLVARHQVRIRRFISRRSGPEVLRRTTVDDLYQATVATALECANNFEYRDDARFLGWIMTIARRVIAQSIRSRRYDPVILRIKHAASSGVGVPETELDAGIRTPSSVVAGHEAMLDLSKAVQALPENYRLAITHYRLEGCSLAEVADRMGRSKAAAAKLVGRALQALRARMVGP